MGYYTDVTCLIYGTPEQMAQLHMKHLHTENVDLKEEFGEDSFEEWEHEGKAFWLFSGSWKGWFEGESERVDATFRFREAAVELGMSYEYIASGEEPDDITQDEGGENVAYYLQLVRVAEVNAPGRPSTTVSEPASA